MDTWPWPCGVDTWPWPCRYPKIVYTAILVNVIFGWITEYVSLVEKIQRILFPILFTVEVCMRMYAFSPKVCLCLFG